jgi:dihydrofolate reductase
LLIQSFLKEDLIDEIIVSTLPVILGGGIPFFGPLSKKVKLRLESSEVIVNQMVQTRYTVEKD